VVNRLLANRMWLDVIPIGWSVVILCGYVILPVLNDGLNGKEEK
jgi:hypothetical protein